MNWKFRALLGVLAILVVAVAWIKLQLIKRACDQRKSIYFDLFG